MAAARRRDVSDILQVLLYDDTAESRDEEDLSILLLDALFSPKPAVDRMCFSLDNLSELECEQLFRFEKVDLVRLCRALNLPRFYHCGQGTKVSGFDTLLIMLRRLAFPNRWCDLVPLFGRAESELSAIFNLIIDDIHGRFKHLLESLNLIWMNPEQFSMAIHDKGAALRQCWDFVDGTVRPIARPTRNQRIMFSGHKRVHCIRFQSVVAPNGLVAHMFGPLEGWRHDAFMLGASGLAQKLQQFNQPNGQPYIIYGDPAYGLSRNIMAPYRGAHLTRQQQDFNRSMSQVHISVEWTFGKITQYFSYLDFKRNAKVPLQPVGKYCLVATILTNCHTCLYGSLTSTFFGVDPPTLEMYLSNM